MVSCAVNAIVDDHCIFPPGKSGKVVSRNSVIVRGSADTVERYPEVDLLKEPLLERKKIKKAYLIPFTSVNH